MGILDDAIREHLELKRQRGATESELKQLEDEAFGPPSRPGEPDFPESEGSAEQSGNGVATQAAADVPDASEEPTEPPSEGILEEQPVAEHPVVEEPSEPAEEPGSSEGALAPDEAPIESLETVEQPFPHEEGETELQPVEEPGSPPDVESEPHGDEGEEADEGQGAPSEEKSEDDDDVLADTPDFLKDAPEDDELWFEQGEPKDFDF
jgi:hypothetical protein